MKIILVDCTAHSVIVELSDGGYFHTNETYRLLVNDVPVKETDRVINSIYHLEQGTEYTIKAESLDGKELASLSVVTKKEDFTLNVKSFGAKGDGVQDDTHFIQAAILSCPDHGRVLIPAGIYSITSLFLKSHVNIELEKGAELRAVTDRSRFALLPGMIYSEDDTKELNIGSWEGNPLTMFAGIITGINVCDVCIYGEGTINGNASKETWWKNPKVKNIAFRPRLFYINHCENITLAGVKLTNSPSWTVHPYFSDDLKFLDLRLDNPFDSPNTDGIDPESCKNVQMTGVEFSLGDDCVAVKSGKIYMGKTYKTPSENIHIRQCRMAYGHGAVTIGSEMAGGVKNLIVEDCEFCKTDRGLRIKTRRGRGKDAVIDGIVFRNLKMDEVMTPLVINSFYFCDPDGKSDYVQSREVFPVDDRTPEIKKLVFENIDAKNCHVAAAFFEGLPEQKIDEVVMRNINISFAENAKEGVPAMSNGVLPCSKKGIEAANIKRLVIDHVAIEGQVGEKLITSGIDELIRE